MTDATPQHVAIPTTVKILEQDGPLDTPCHIWQGYVGNQGYPVRTRRRGLPTVNREAYLIAHGSIPTGYVLHHWCENKLCVNVDHMGNA
jgi:hypothetical protein